MSTSYLLSLGYHGHLSRLHVSILGWDMDRIDPMPVVIDVSVDQEPNDAFVALVCFVPDSLDANEVRRGTF